MMYNFLFFANQGMDIIRIDAVPYILERDGHILPEFKTGTIPLSV